MIEVVGHRGAAGIYPENTLKSIRYAVELAVDLVEFDVRMTRDSHLVIMHDETVDRTTNGSGLVSTLDFNTIRSLDAGEGEKVPTLEEVLEAIQGKVKAFCELKGEGVVDATLDSVQRRGMDDQVVFLAFQPERLGKIKSHGKHLQTCLTCTNPTEEELALAVELDAQYIGAYYENINLKMVKQVSEAGLILGAWNPDLDHEIKAMIALGTPNISTNRPDILIRCLQEQGLR